MRPMVFQAAILQSGFPLRMLSHRRGPDVCARALPSVIKGCSGLEADLMRVCFERNYLFEMFVW